jgi:inorganic pyrophosphatase
LDHGFIPGTLAEDGDPLDAMIMTGEPTFPGCYVLVRPVAVFWLTDEHGPNAKILSVPTRDPRHVTIRDLPDVGGIATSSGSSLSSRLTRASRITP